MTATVVYLAQSGESCQSIVYAEFHIYLINFRSYWARRTTVSRWCHKRRGRPAARRAGRSSTQNPTHTKDGFRVCRLSQRRESIERFKTRLLLFPIKSLIYVKENFTNKLKHSLWGVSGRWRCFTGARVFLRMDLVVGSSSSHVGRSPSSLQINERWAVLYLFIL